jgi:hypothetical protein
VIFMALPLVDNFWQAQGTIMVTPRLPLYIPCVYVCFMYLPTVGVWRLGLSPLPRATLTGLAAILFYAPYDITGAKFLWWTWHDTDMPIDNRLVGVPVGNTLWVIVFVATFAWLLGRQVDKDPAISSRTFIKATALVGALCSIVMVLQMTVIQQLDSGVPGVRGLIVTALIYGGIAARGWLKATRPPAGSGDRLLLAGIAGYYLVLLGIMATFEPSTHVSTSLHQTYGECGVEAKDIAGFTRFKFICAEEYDEDFTFCEAPPAIGAGWYPVCGKAHTNKPLWLGAVAGLGLVGTLLFGMFYGAVGKEQ